MNEPLTGLSEAEAAARRERGQGNEVELRTTRSYLQILRNNAFTFINIILFGISLVLMLMRQYGDALVTAGLVLMNVVVGSVQEGRAKHRLERIALLTRPQVTVLREGCKLAVDPAEVVLGDLLVANPGDQVVVDGQIVGAGCIEVDESLLSGESERVPKSGGDVVYSGSFCISGSALYEAQKVGAQSLVNQLTASARAFRQGKTPLQRDIDYVIRILVLLVGQLGILIGISFLTKGIPLVEWVRVAAVIVALVPQGLFFMTTAAYAMGALRVAGSGALIQQANAVESVSNVDLLCLDKTGTLTTNRLQLHSLCPLGSAASVSEPALQQLLGDFAASVSGGNRTTAAIQEAFGGQPSPVEHEVPFASDWKWSALAFRDTARPGIYVLGAPEMLIPHLQEQPGLGPQIDAWTKEGLRVLLFAHHAHPVLARNGDGIPELPSGLNPLCLLSLRDELRPEARATLERFCELGIELRIISGDNPHTVAALARQIGFASDAPAISGLELQVMDELQLASTAEQATIFGRITPQQKERLVSLFRRQGHYVAMIGDGINDVLSLKQANVGIAMQSGSAATRGVADLVLLEDSFGALPTAFREGQRIVKGMEDVVRLLLTRTFYVLLLVIATQIVGAPFPVTPRHNSVLALLTVGIPILAIAAWARPGAAPRSVIRATSSFVFPAAFSVSVVALAVYLSYLQATSDVTVARSALTSITVLCGLVLIAFVEPPTQWWAGGDVLSGDPRPAILSLGMLALYACILAVPPLRDFFELVALRPLDYLYLALTTVAWTLILRTVWRLRIFQRLLAPPKDNPVAPCPSSQ